MSGSLPLPVLSNYKQHYMQMSPTPKWIARPYLSLMTHRLLKHNIQPRTTTPALGRMAPTGRSNSLGHVNDATGTLSYYCTGRLDGESASRRRCRHIKIRARNVTPRFGEKIRNAVGGKENVRISANKFRTEDVLYDSLRGEGKKKIK